MYYTRGKKAESWVALGEEDRDSLSGFARDLFCYPVVSSPASLEGSEKGSACDESYFRESMGFRGASRAVSSFSSFFSLSLSFPVGSS